MDRESYRLESRVEGLRGVGLLFIVARCHRCSVEVSTHRIRGIECQGSKSCHLGAESGGEEAERSRAVTS